MTNHPDPTADPPPDDARGGGGTNEFADLDAREALFTTALQQADQIANRMQAMRLQLMLAGFDAMVLEEEAQGRVVRLDDICVRAFVLHQSTVLKLPRQTVFRQLQDGWTLRDHLPRTWAVFLDGRCSPQAASIVAAESGGLKGDDLAEYDRVAAELAEDDKPTVLLRELGVLRDGLDPEAVIDRHGRATNRRCVTGRPLLDGQASLTITSSAVDIAAMLDGIRQAAITAHGREGECRTLGQLMADIAADVLLHGLAVDAPDLSDPAYPMERIGSLRVPHRKAVQATVLVVMPASTATGADDQPGEVAGMGSIDADVARRIIQHTSTWSRVLTDPVDNAIIAFDSKERFIPSALKRLIHLRTPTCVGDDCGLPAHRADIDHVVRVEHDGRTRHTNLQPLCRPSHQMKDDGGHWTVSTRDDGTMVWRSRWGATRIMRPVLKVRTQGTPIGGDDCPF